MSRPRKNRGVNFHPALSPAVTRGLMLTVIAYFPIRMFLKGFEYPFGLALLLGLGVALWKVSKLLRSGLRAGESGLEVIGSKRSIAWDEIESLEFSFRKQFEGLFGAWRITEARGPGKKVLRFGNLSSSEPVEGGVYNLKASNLLLAMIVAKTGAAELYPHSWKSVEEEEPEEAPGAAEPDKMSLLSKLGPAWGLWAVAFKVLPKLGGVALKLLKTIKPAAALVAIGAYTLIFSWKFAFALVGMILFHECGHVYAMYRSGVRVRGIYFIPFMGGAAVSEGVAKTHGSNAYIAINGPVWGTALVFLCLVGYWLSGGNWPVLAALAGWGALINLFNLLPIFPLDGGRILNSVATSISTGFGAAAVLVSLMFGAGLAYATGFELLLLMVLIGMFEASRRLDSSVTGASIRALGPRFPLDFAAHEHFSDSVEPVMLARKTETQVAAREAAFKDMKKEALQRPMSVRQVLAVLGGYGALVALLLTALLIAHGVPGTGNPADLLR